jgi:hypothetical protein
MSDVLIAILQFPNDPTNNRVAHQMFLATQTGSTIDLYSISSILGKEKRVYGPNKNDYVTILPPEHVVNGFKVPSFIDCTKTYQISISTSMNLSALTQRSLSPELRKRILEKISEKKAEGKHTIYPISEADFKMWNPKI